MDTTYSQRRRCKQHQGYWNTRSVACGQDKSTHYVRIVNKIFRVSVSQNKLLAKLGGMLLKKATTQSK